jgi:very-short-patch-repair endonuclease
VTFRQLLGAGMSKTAIQRRSSQGRLHRIHRGRQAFEDDRARDMQLRLLGYEVLRVTYQQLMFQKASLVKALRSVLETPTR